MCETSKTKWMVSTICMKVVKQNVKEQYKKICMESVKQFGYALKYVKEQDKKICME
jgi:hypothetical protein